MTKHSHFMRLKLPRRVKAALPAAVAALILLAGVYFYVRHSTFAVLQPRGTIAYQERKLMIIAMWLAILVVIPVFVLLFYILWKYRAGNDRARYNPEWHGSRWLEATWWLIPGSIILVMSIISWRSTHALDPNKALLSDGNTITIQVIALDWKWLFVYPDQHVASLNEVRFPEHTAVDFAITADAPMNSFWIPQLGGQIYAMPGMTTHLHLSASQAGKYTGRSANLSGAGFSGMQFNAISSTAEDFNSWLGSVENAPKSLTTSTYDALAAPSSDQPVTYYHSVSDGLFSHVLSKYMAPAGVPGSEHSSMKNMPGMDM